MTSNQEDINVSLLIEQSKNEIAAIKKQNKSIIDCINASIIIAILCLCIACILFGRMTKDDVEVVKTDTITIVRIDTMVVEKPTIVYKEIVRHDTIKIEDLVVVHDTTGQPSVILPIEQTVYHDSTETASYDAYVSGYHAALDSIFIYCQSKETIITKVEREKARRLGAGIQCGLGVSAQGLAAPYIGIGLQYRLW